MRAAATLRDAGRATGGDDPVFWTDVLQVVKTVVAAVIALGARDPGLRTCRSRSWRRGRRCWSCTPTVYRTFSQGARQVGRGGRSASLVAWAVGNLLGLGSDRGRRRAAGRLRGRALPWLSGQGTAVAATAVVVLTTGFADNDNMLVHAPRGHRRSASLTGLLVNLAGLAAAAARGPRSPAMDALDDRIGELLGDMGDGLAAGCTRDGRARLDRPDPRPRRGPRPGLGAGAGRPARARG